MNWTDILATLLALLGIVFGSQIIRDWYERRREAARWRKFCHLLMEALHVLPLYVPDPVTPTAVRAVIRRCLQEAGYPGSEVTETTLAAALDEAAAVLYELAYLFNGATRERAQAMLSALGEEEATLDRLPRLGGESDERLRETERTVL
jgi:hypothetical protein